MFKWVFNGFVHSFHVLQIIPNTQNPNASPPNVFAPRAMCSTGVSVFPGLGLICNLILLKANPELIVGTESILIILIMDFLNSN
jgi:hypothetical protein